jgi:glucose/arabinose dehydrogenase
MRNVCSTLQVDPCQELATRGGIWRFPVDAWAQQFDGSFRYATGIRNAMAIAIHPVTHELWAAQHGMDNLHTQYPSLFPGAEGIENPAEELFEVRQGDDFGWPYCYYDTREGRRVLAPDYGGNRSVVGRCANTKATNTTFPAHWAPNGLLFYTGTAFPARYRNGAFVAFHGSSNRDPGEQQGFLVAFVPASGPGLAATYEVFADGFKGAATILDPGDAAHRPTGLAMDSSGALYIGDDLHGRIWRVTYRGP